MRQVRFRTLAPVLLCTVLLPAALALTPASAEPLPEPGRYIVHTTTATSTGKALGRLRSPEQAVSNRYSRVLHGFAARLTASEVAALRAEPGVVAVRPDTAISVKDTETRTTQIQAAPPWGLDRIDQRAQATDDRYSYGSTGKGVTAFVLDTGVLFSHEEFGGRAVSGYDFVDRDGNALDCNGHGTHVAGTIGGRTYGVAKEATIVAVRVFDCAGRGWASDFIAGLDWVVAHRPAGPAVVNYSGGGGVDLLSDAAVIKTVSAGIPVVVAAGNEYDPACESSPARTPAAITVGATDSYDWRAMFSNYGSCVDLFAPGMDVESASIVSNTAAERFSGTSMAAPHVAGAIARMLEMNPVATPRAVATGLVANATQGAISDAKGSPNLLLFTSDVAAAPEKPTGLKATANAKDKTVTVRWSRPLSGGSTPLTGFQLTRDGSDTAGRGPIVVNVSSAAGSYTFTSMRTGTRYRMTVRARNSVGLGSAAATTVTTLSLPGRAGIREPRSGSTADRSVSVTARWSAPMSGGPVTGYRVVAVRVATGKTTTVTTGSSARSVSVKGLIGGARYVVRVYATNAAGKGPRSAHSSAVRAR
jgi:subtilisin family serine protease